MGEIRTGTWQRVSGQEIERNQEKNNRRHYAFRAHIACNFSVSKEPIKNKN